MSTEDNQSQKKEKTKLITIEKIVKTLHNNHVPEHRLAVYKTLQESVFCEPSLETLNDFFKAWENKKNTSDYDSEYDKYIQLCLDFELCEPGRLVRKHLGKPELTMETKILIKYSV